MNKIIVIISISLFFSCNQVGDKSEVSTNLANSSKTKIEKSFISFRIHPPQSLPDVRFDELLELFEKYKGVTDEITFFTHTTHAPIPIDSIRQSVAILKDRMVEVRKRGYKTGINLLTTIGHHDENFENSLKGDYTYMTDIDGEICLGSFCPNDDNMREYIRSIYQIVAKAHPDYIWIDDDIRLGWHHTNGLACFCDNCLTIFEEETGAKYTRESLKEAMNEGPGEEKLKLRKAWLQHNRNTIAYLFRLIEETVHGIDPDISLGFMTCDRLYEGYDFGNWAKILAGPNNTPVMWRPGGGGYYNDIKTNELAGKSQAIGRQVSVLPQEVLSIQSEIENFPYQRLRKAANIVVLETCSHIAAGCTGAAFNVLSMYDEPLDEFEPLVARLLEARPFFDLLAKS